MDLEGFLSPGRVTRLLVGVVILLCAASLAGQVCKYELGHGNLFGFVPLFDVDNEVSIPTWYSSLALFACAALLATVARAKQALRAAHAVRWWLLAGLFLYMSVDEGAAVHETLVVGPLLRALGDSGWRYFAWVLPGSFLVAAVAIAYWRFWLDLPAVTRARFLAAALLFVGGALGMELVAGLFLRGDGHIESLSYAALTTVEELLEMLGVVVMIHAVRAYRQGDASAPAAGSVARLHPVRDLEDAG